MCGDAAEEVVGEQGVATAWGERGDASEEIAGDIWATNERLFLGGVPTARYRFACSAPRPPSAPCRAGEGEEDWGGGSRSLHSERANYALLGGSPLDSGDGIDKVE